MKCKLLHHTRKAIPDNGYFAAGTILDVRTHERFSRDNIIMLVRIGAAEPADDECRKAIETIVASGLPDGVGQEKVADETDKLLEQVRVSYQRVNKGIHPDDFDLFDRGVIDGYDAQGNYVPGPNYDEAELEDVDDEDDEEEEEEYDDE